ncbi:hypothetical protein ACQJBY_054319 [Aegilops geniculata]
MGHAIAGEGFFCLQCPDDAREEQQILLGANMAVLSMPSGMLTQEILEGELPHLFEGAWDWQITPLEGGAFKVVFPDPAMLRMATRSGKLFLSLNNLMVDIRDVVLDAPKGLEMPEVWVKLGGVPPKQRRSDRLMAATTMLGRPLLVDEESLIHPGPVRMRFACRNPRKLRGLVQIWFNGEGFNITIDPELPPEQLAAPALPSPNPPPNHGKGPDETGRDGDKDGDKELDASMEDNSINMAAWEKLGITDMGGAPNRAQQPMMEQPLAGRSMEMELSIPNQYGSNLGSVTSPPVRMEAAAGSDQMVEPLGDARTPIAVSVDSLPLSSRSPTQGGHISNKLGAVKQLKKVAMRKVSAESGRAAELLGAPATPRQAVMALAVPTPAPLAQESSKTAPFPKAKRSKTVVEG